MSIRNDGSRDLTATNDGSAAAPAQESALPTSATDQAILDAARACVIEFGLRRTTLSEVARRAGVSRPTVYRRWPDTRTLIAELLTREMRAAVRGAPGSGPTARAQLVSAITAGASVIGANPMFAKIFRTDADMIVVYIVTRLGRSQRELIAHFAKQISAGQRDGSIRPGNPDELAAMLLLIGQSAVQSARMVAPVLNGARLSAELRYAVEAYLRPGGPP
jgi:AcrR family transcriptional regulator